MVVDVHNRQAGGAEGRQKFGNPRLGPGIGPGIALVPPRCKSLLSVNDQKQRARWISHR